MATEPVVKPQTWADNAKDIIASVVNWMLVECVASKTRWNSLTDGDGLVTRGMELAHEMTVHRGIPLGTMTLTPGGLLTAMQETAIETGAPGHQLPMQPDAPLVTAPEVVPLSTDAASLTDWERAGLTEAEWDALTDEQRAEKRLAHP